LEEEKMKVFAVGNELRVELTTRNLKTLLAMQEQGIANASICKLSEGDGMQLATITAVDDESHYSDRQPGWMPNELVH